MRKIFISCIILLCCSFCSFAQFTENFTDGDFTNNPAWVGGTADWTVNGSFQLQSNNTVLNSTYYLSTASAKATSAEWNFFLQLDFNTSSANYVDVFLTASASDLTQPATTGYFLRFGGTPDEVSLYRKDNGTSTIIINGGDGFLNNSVNAMLVKVIRDNSNQWSVTVTLNGGPATNVGFTTDAIYTTSAFFGLLVKQSTASFFQKHFLDDINVTDFVPDLQPPFVITYTVTSQTTVDVLFNEPVEQLSAETVSNYVVDNGIGSPVSATRDLSNASLVHLLFATNFPGNVNLQITINGVNDLSANPTSNLTGNFSYIVPVIAVQYDIIIDELMADPSPQVTLPDLEWLELKNTSGADIDLAGWKLGKGTTLSGAMPAYILKADSFVIICATASAVTELSVYGPAKSVTNFPSLSNDGDLIYLNSPQGTTIHAVNYSSSWYQNTVKAGGGWTLEMIDTHNPCSGASNWKASEDIRGGTPAKRNSIDGVNPDETAPRLLRAYAPDNLNVVLVFDESLNGSNASVAGSYSISDGIGTPVSAIPAGTVFDRINLVLATPLLPNKIYTVTAATLITDCVGNGIGVKNTARVALAEPTVDSFSIVINEVLFNPKSTSTDYVELYNRSNKILNLKNVYIANASSTPSVEHLSEEDYLFFPEDFIVVTENKDLVMHDYVANDPYAFIELSLPSYSDDSGTVILLNEQGRTIDKVHYLDDWHFQLIHDDDGVALERTDYEVASQNAANWHSAAKNVNYGTPTYKNSQYRVNAGVQGEIKIDPEIFSPDNDGRDDFATILYSFPEPGYVANITIFDAVGRRVRDLERNALCGLKGYFRWDGLAEKSQKLPVGIYVIYTEVFNLQGKTKKFKNTIVLARKQ